MASRKVFVHPRGDRGTGSEAPLSSSEVAGAAGTSGLTLCIVNHQGASYLAATLEAVAAVSGGFREILLVDNASTDAGPEIARAACPSVRIVALPENRGPGAARNAGLREARTDRILFIDNDVRPEPDCPARLSAALDERPDVAFAMPRTVYAEDPGTIQWDGAQSHFAGVVIPHNADRPLDGAPPPTECGSLITACFLMDRARWRGAELFDERVFLYLEDHEAGLRARLQGYRILAVPEAICRHGLGTVGVSVRETGRVTPLRVTQTIRNRWRIVLKLYDARTLVLLSPALVLFELVQVLGAVKKGWIRPWLGALRATIADVASIRRARRAFRGTRRLPDGAVLVGGPLPYNAATLASPLERLVARGLDAAMNLNWRLVQRALGAGAGRPAGEGRRVAPFREEES